MSRNWTCPHFPDATSFCRSKASSLLIGENRFPAVSVSAEIFHLFCDRIEAPGFQVAFLNRHYVSVLPMKPWFEHNSRQVGGTVLILHNVLNRAAPASQPLVLRRVIEQKAKGLKSVVGQV